MNTLADVQKSAINDLAALGLVKLQQVNVLIFRQQFFVCLV